MSRPRAASGFRALVRPRGLSSSSVFSASTKVAERTHRHGRVSVNRPPAPLEVLIKVVRNRPGRVLMLRKKQECWNEPTEDADSVAEMLGDQDLEIRNCLAPWTGRC